MAEPSRAARFGALLAALWAAHDVADHLLQTDPQAGGKAGHAAVCLIKHPGRSCTVASWEAMAGHVGSYTALQLATIAWARTLGIRPSWRRIVVAVVVSAGTHALLDRRWPVRWILEHTGSPRFARMLAPICGPYQADQACHHGCIAITAAILAGGRRG